MKRTCVYLGLVVKATKFFRGENARVQIRQHGAPAFRSKIEGQVRFGMSGAMRTRKYSGNSWRRAPL